MNQKFIFAEWLLELFKLHVFWIGYLFRGGLFFGLFPATAAVYAIVRHWMLKRHPETLSFLFRKYYKENFVVSNKIGYLLTLLTGIITMNIIYIPIYHETIRLIMYVILIFLSIIVLIVWIYFFPTIVHFNCRVGDCLIFTFQFSMLSLNAFFLHVLLFGIFIIVIYAIPAVFLVFGIIPMVCTQMAVNNNLYEILRRKKEEGDVNRHLASDKL
ncbi:YesL family protein [Gracilibacillus alcaliphilus]|uniref:YesL family protein n=1 Tax=Gracilibacillus alcaliphilus TaxID=1401441 RepID=UPI00195E0262|nr:DUF624 domain-containing protein [Gracilibacillus alcaliphilus]MBM7676394.1 putative membrane protein YesL [Gracilibacillus alcaliphilus]